MVGRALYLCCCHIFVISKHQFYEIAGRPPPTMYHINHDHFTRKIKMRIKVSLQYNMIVFLQVIYNITDKWRCSGYGLQWYRKLTESPQCLITQFHSFNQPTLKSWFISILALFHKPPGKNWYIFDVDVPVTENFMFCNQRGFYHFGTSRLRDVSQFSVGQSACLHIWAILASLSATRRGIWLLDLRRFDDGILKLRVLDADYCNVQSSDSTVWDCLDIKRVLIPPNCVILSATRSRLQFNSWHESPVKSLVLTSDGLILALSL